MIAPSSVAASYTLLLHIINHVDASKVLGKR